MKAVSLNKRMMRAAGLILAIVLTAATWASAAGTEETSGPAGIVATVNGHAILKTDLDRETYFAEQSMKARNKSGDPRSVSDLSKQVLEKLIEQELLYQDSVEKSITVSDEEITAAVADLKSRYGSETAFQAALNKLNLTADTLKLRLMRQMAISHLIENDIVKKIEISDDSVRDFYDSNAQMFMVPEQVRASHILVKVDPSASDKQKAAAMEKIRAIQKKLAAGEDFAQLARDYSEGPSNAKGGDLGFFGRGQMVKPFETAAFSMKPGEISDVVETSFGYHLIRVSEKNQEGIIEYAEVKPKIASHLKEKEVRDRMTSYLQGLRNRADVVYSRY